MGNITNLLEKILTSAHFENRPPVLIDIGASGGINKKWKKIKPHCICISFDADDRDFNLTDDKTSGYKKLIIINRVVTNIQQENTEFYLTCSPYCSSTLEPEDELLQPWLFRSYFKVENKIQLKSVTLSDVLDKENLNYIDWFKTDSQGTDLRIYNTLPTEIKEQILVAELEPGIIDAYKGEDKLYSILEQFREDGFWLSEMKPRGTQRINEKYIKDFTVFKIENIIPSSPCWTELTYFREVKNQNLRKLLLLFVFAVIEEQWGFALEVCDKMNDCYDDPIIQNCKVTVYNKLKNEKVKVPNSKRMSDFLFRILHH